MVLRSKPDNATCRIALLHRQQQRDRLLLQLTSTRENAKTKKLGVLESRSLSAGHLFKLPLAVESHVGCASQQSLLLLSAVVNGSLGRLGLLVLALAREASLSLESDAAESTAANATEKAQKQVHARLDLTATLTSISSVRTNQTIAMSMPSKDAALIASSKTG